MPVVQRYTTPPNADRASGGMAWDTTAVLAPTGEIMVVGGGNTPDTIDLYQPMTNTWRSFPADLLWDNGASVLLPDGTVLLISGSDRTDVNAVPPPQTFDPFTGALMTLPHLRPVHRRPDDAASVGRRRQPPRQSLDGAADSGRPRARWRRRR